jgi:inner membrane protein
VDNITHSLIGATLAELAVPATASSAQRRLFFTAGIIAANLPDADLVYTAISPPPIGYLLHHRGHTHTLVGCVALAAAFWLVVKIIPGLRRAVSEAPRRFWTLIAVALLSHLTADSWNVYGVHPFWPFDNRWYYGDAINIYEPWLFLFLGIAAAWNTKHPGGRLVMTAIVVALPLALAWLGMMASGALVALSIVGIGLGWAMRHMPPARRSALATTAVIVFVLGMFGMNRIAHAASVASLPEREGELVDVVLSPRAAVPVCWTTLTIQKDESRGEYVLRRGQLALFANVCGTRTDVATVDWSTPLHESLPRLRGLARDDCWVRAWLQFGRAPVVTATGISDIRFGSAGFTNMPIGGRAGCPQHLTNWTMPRADLGLEPR